MRVLIFGGSGLLGERLAIHLEHDYEVFVTYRNFKPNQNIKSFRFEVGDDEKALIDEIRPDVVINCAGLTSVEMCEANPAYAVSVNEKFPASLAFLSKRQSFRFVHISTDHFLSRPFDKRDETCEFTSINIYGKTKLSADQHILKSECAALICRTNFVGFSFKQRVSYFNWLVSRLCEKEPIFAFDDVFFTPIGIGSLCEYIRLLLESSYSGILNVAGVESISKYDFALMVRSRLQSETLVIPKSIDSAALVQRPKNLSLDTSKLQKMFPDKRESLEFVLDELVDDSFLQYFKI